MYFVAHAIRSRVLVAFLFAGCLVPPALKAQQFPGDFDSSFRPIINVNGPITTLVLEGEKLLVGGTMNGNELRLVRLTPDGAVDGSFKEQLPEGRVHHLYIQANGKILVGGFFLRDGKYVGIVRLNADGSLDTSFSVDANVGFPRGGPLLPLPQPQDGLMIPLSDGQIITGKMLPGGAGLRVIRLNEDGGEDTSYPGLTIDNFFQQSSYSVGFALARQEPDRVLISGVIPTCRTLRFNDAGQLSPGFDYAASPGCTALDGVRVLPQNKILLALLDGSGSAYTLWKLEPEGALDASFTPSTFGPTLSALLPQPDGKVLLGGAFTNPPQSSLSGALLRLNSDGKIDSEFRPAFDPAASNVVTALTFAWDGGVYVAGTFFATNSQVPLRLAKLFTGIAPALPSIVTQPVAVNSKEGQSALFSVEVASPTPVSYQWQKDGIDLPNAQGGALRFSAIAASDAGSYQVSVRNMAGVVSSQTVRLTVEASANSPGAQDLSFDPKLLSRPPLLLQPDGRVLARSGLANTVVRFEVNGTLDSGFNAPEFFGPFIGRILPSPSPPGEISALAVQRDGSVLVGGYFDGLLARLKANGQADPTFAPSMQPTYEVTGAVLNEAVTHRVTSIALAGTNIVAVGDFAQVNGLIHPLIARLDLSGQLDRTFDPLGLTNSSVTEIVCNLNNLCSNSVPVVPRAVLVQGDGKLVVAGALADSAPSSSWAPWPLFRVNTTGSLDSTFVPPADRFRAIRAMALEPDGKLLVAADKSTGNLVELVRLMPTGTLDPAFSAKGTDSRLINAIVPQPDGKIIIVGAFTNIAGATRNYAARLLNDGTLDPGFDPGQGPDSPITAAILQPDGRLLISGSFQNVSGAPRPGLARLYASAIGFMMPANPQITPAGFETTIATQLGWNYTLESSEDLNGGVWTAGEMIAGDGNLRRLTDVQPLTKARFYRVRQTSSQ